MPFAKRNAVIASGLFIICLLGACGGSSPNGPGNNTGVAGGPVTFSTPTGFVPGQPPTNRFAMANGCYHLVSVSADAAISRNGASYNAAAAGTEGEPFLVKPTALGEYLLYASDRQMPTVNGNTVVAEAAPSDAAVWIAQSPQGGQFTLQAKQTGQALLVDAGGTLSVGTASNGNDRFRFIPSQLACTPYPEMPLSITGPIYKGTGVDQPIIGFADVHSHIGMSHEMSADDSVGPAAGGAFYGQPFHRFGVTHAMGNCADFHGPDGSRDGNNIIAMDPSQTHDTEGWPNYLDWPAIHQLTHQSAYYRWMERAYRSGLRVLVTYGTNIKGLCDVAASFTGNPTADCEDHSVGLKQNAYIHDIQNYVDAQSGGPGMGWFRIVTSPQQARQVINDGKLAVVLGLEASQLFDCGVTFLPGGGEVPNCTRASFDQKLEEAYALGMRQVVPLHDIDNAFGGGSVLTNGTALNALNFLDTKSFFKTVDCPNGGEEGYLVPGGGFLTGVPVSGDDPISAAVVTNLQGPVPTYPPDRRQCNSRELTDLGRYALEQLMAKGVIISLDHVPMLSKKPVLDLATAQNPPYPMISGHGAQGGITNDDAQQLMQAGGYYYPYKPDGANFVSFMGRVKALYDQAAAIDNSRMLPFAFGYGYDVNGFGGYNPPRIDPEQLVNYPFTLFSGDGWGPQFAAAGIQPVVVDKLSIPNGRSWDTERDGTAHYGLIADFVEEIRLEGGEEAVTAFYNSAEVYLQLWERVYQAP